MRIIEVVTQPGVKPIWINDNFEITRNRETMLEDLCKPHEQVDFRYLHWKKEYTDMLQAQSETKQNIFEILWKDAKKRS